MHKITSKLISAALSLATAASTVAGQVPAAAMEDHSITAKFDSMSFRFSDELGQGLQSVSLSGDADFDTDEIKTALGLDEEQKVYAVSPDYAWEEDEEKDGSLLMSISGDDIRKDSGNVRLFAVPAEETSAFSADDIATYEVEPEDGYETASWEIATSENLILAIDPAETKSVSAGGKEIEFAGVNRSAEVLASEEEEPDSSLSIQMENLSFLPEKIQITGMEANEQVFLQCGEEEMSLSGKEDADTASYSIEGDLKETLGNAVEDGSLSFSLQFQSQSKKPAKVRTAAKAPSSGSSLQGSITLREGSTTQKEKELASGEVFAADKYITKNDGEELNGQNVYTTTIEQAVHSNNAISAKAPEKQEIFLALDASATMTDKVDSLNDAVRSFFYEVQQANKDRVEKWNSGYYKNTNGDSVENHLLTIKAVVKYNNHVTSLVSGNGVTPMDASDVDSLCNLTHIRAGYEPEGSLQDMTRTDLALARLKNAITDPEHSSVILMTDGEPYGRGEEGSFDYDSDTTSGIMMTFENTNDALQTAREIKDNGSVVYSVYVQTGYPTGILDQAKANRDIHSLATTSAAAGSQSKADMTLGCAFLSLVSSDYPKNGLMHGIQDPKEANDKYLDGTYDDPGKGTFGKYFKMPNESGQIVNDFTDVAKDIDYRTSYNSGYAGKSSYIYDVISYPFQGDTAQGVSVYQVPRICTGTDASRNKIFTWGEEEEITDQVSASMENGRFITVRGYDYEENAVSDYSKSGDDTTYPSASGDYGYKIVVRFKIYSNRIFGGNGIETNDSTISGFYPSDPSKDAPIQTKWKDSDANTEQTDYILLYPIPMVDLNIDYAIVSDNMVIYAPQTAKLQNLVTDANGNLFATDSAYETVKADYENAQTAQARALSSYETAAQEYAAATGTSEEAAKKAALENAIDAYNEAKTVFANAQKAYDAVQNYIPDGDNNAYVDIHYVLKDPEGNSLATMDIPHGVPYTGSNFVWQYSGKTEITKHGNYTITATVTPVDTTREESHTGSTASGTGKPTDFSAEPFAHIYVLHLTGIDSAVDNHEGFGLIEDTNVAIGDIEKTSWMKDSITTGNWTALDGTTPQDNHDAQPDGTGSTKAMGSQPGVSLYIPDKTHVDGTSGSFSAKGKNGDYIPVAAEVYRQAGNLNKDADLTDQITTKKVALNDNDNLYLDAAGNPVSSVTWDHECDVITNCDHTDFAVAKADNDAMDGEVQKNVRFLLHIQTMILPHVMKKTQPTVQRGADLKWTITADNMDSEKNPDRLISDTFLLDVLPYTEDKRQDPETGEDLGSKFNSSLYFKSVIIDCSQANAAYESFKDGSKAVYYTTSDEIRTIELNDNAIRKFAWSKAEVICSDADKTISVTLPQDSKALRIDAKLNFGDQLSAQLTAGVSDPDNEQLDDYYLNQAFAISKNGRTASNVTKTTVSSSYISGLVWEDTNGNGMQDANEKTIQNVKVGLYTKHNPSGPGAAITVDGVEYDAAFNADGNAINLITTGEDGAYKFNNLKSDTYYVIAQNIDGQYTIAKKQAVTNADLDSDAAEQMPAIVNNAGLSNASSKTTRAWIKDIAVTNLQSREHMDIGLLLVKGSLDVTKELDQIYFPSTMTEEEKKTYYPTFHFTLTDANGKKWYQTVKLSERDLTGACTFTDLPLGTYTLEEAESLNYTMESIQSDDLIQKNEPKRITRFEVTAVKQDFHVTYRNKMTGIPPAGDQNQVINHIPMHTPIKLDLTYSGPAVISSKTAMSYSFTADEIKGVVTYDDGSTQEVTIGSNGFTLSPSMVTNTMNTHKNNRVSIYGYYSEKGVTLEDSFQVGVDLKPPHKFTVVYHANSSRFSGGSDVNTVSYLYDASNDRFYAYNGSYEAPVSLGSDFTFMGWSTSENGAAGTKYDNEAALKTAAVDEGVTQIDLYARWLTYYAFNGNGGNVTPSKVSAYVGDYIPSSPSVSASRSGYGFEGWFTSADLSNGQWINDLSESDRKITGPRTFYAVWSKSHFTRVGYVEEFTAIRSGTYQINAYGAAGGGDLNNDYGQRREDTGGNGGAASGRIHLNAGDKLYVCVGAHGNTPCSYGDDRGWAGGRIDYSGGGYNGGAGVGGDGQSGCGGGATSVTTTNRGVLSNFNSYRSEVLIVAGGGGGGSYARGGGAGGSGGGASFGSGQYGPSGGGGGGGWSGGSAGWDNHNGSNGGTSYVSSAMSNGSQRAGGGAGYHGDGWCDIVRVGD